MERESRMDGQEPTNGELAVMLTNVEGKIDAVQACLNAHEPRIRSLENWRSFIIGGLALLTFLVTVFGLYFLMKVLG